MKRSSDNANTNFNKSWSNHKVKKAKRPTLNMFIASRESPTVQNAKTKRKANDHAISSYEKTHHLLTVKYSYRQEDGKSTYKGLLLEIQQPFDYKVFYTYSFTTPLQVSANHLATGHKTKPTKNIHKAIEGWTLIDSKRTLTNSDIRISLTPIELLLLKKLILSRKRVCSTDDLIRAIKRDSSTYTGLEMCLSRLQKKFHIAYGERLFRSVRNRGYCLVQEVKINS